MKPLDRTSRPRASATAASSPSVGAVGRGALAPPSVARTSAGRCASTPCRRSGENGRRRVYTKLSMPNRCLAVVAEALSACEWECEWDASSCACECEWDTSSCACACECAAGASSAALAASSACACEWAALWQISQSAASSACACECVCAEGASSAASAAAPSACAWECDDDALWIAASTASLCSSTGPRAAAPSARAAPRTSTRGASPRTHDWTCALALRAETTASSLPRSAPETRSALLRRTTSAHSTCSTRRSTTARWIEPSKWPITKVCASSDSAMRSGRSAAVLVSPYASRNAAASTTVTSVSSEISSMSGISSKTASWNVSRIARGSATPVASMTMWSYRKSRYLDSATSWLSVENSSSAIEQQMQPSPSSTNSAAASPGLFNGGAAATPVPPEDPSSLLSNASNGLRTSFESTLTAATSFTMTPTRSSLALADSRSFWSSVVLPAPRNPDRSVTGIFGGGAEVSSPIMSDGADAVEASARTAGRCRTALENDDPSLLLLPRTPQAAAAVEGSRTVRRVF
mmetsp:Transcript_13466/g.54033  ORF Transcript_13466/g.54033 Transcript_13466/m.54033 type:complete len:526 (+) Transcript_13466:674-2251(+)